MILVYHMISQDHMIKESCDFIGRSPARLVTILPRKVAKNAVIVKTDLSLFRDLVRLRDQRVT